MLFRESSPPQVADLGAAVDRLNREKVKLEQQMVHALTYSRILPALAVAGAPKGLLSSAASSTSSALPL